MLEKRTPPPGLIEHFEMNSKDDEEKDAAEKKSKADEKETKASEASDEEIKECAIDGSECQTPDGKCIWVVKGAPQVVLEMCTRTPPAANLSRTGVLTGPP